MSSVQPVNYGYVQNGYNKTSTQVAATCRQPCVMSNPDVINCNDLYSQREIKNILKEIGTLQDKLPNMPLYVPRYTIEFYKTSGTVVIDNKSCTNDTTEILKDGSVRHVGSWHNKEVAPAGSFTSVVEEVKNRIKEDLTH